MSWLIPLDIGFNMGLVLAWSVLALALGFRLLNFPDLTVEGSLPLGAAVFAVLHKAGIPMTLSVCSAMIAGCVAGSLTAFLHIRFKMNKFLAGILVVAITYSLSLRIMKASNIGLLQLPTIFDVSEPLNKGGFHMGTMLVLFLFIIITSIVVISGLSSRPGIKMRLSGSNPDYARSLGVNVPLNLMAGLAITNSFAALSGVLLAMHQGFADVGMGHGVLILALAAMTIGERILPEKHMPFQIFVFCSAVLGSIIYQVLVSYAIRIGLAPTDLKLATAIMVLGVIALRFNRQSDLFSDVH